MEVSSSSSLAVVAMAVLCWTACRADFTSDVDVTWGDGRGKIMENGALLQLSMDKSSGSGFQSKAQFLFARVDMQIKLIAGDSAGTVTAYYLSSQGPFHDEIDMEFLGNASGQPYSLHTNVYAQGKGGREQEFKLWFDPTADFHTYTIVWNPSDILFYVDGMPIRAFHNMEAKGLAYPTSQAMRLYGTLWDAEGWATQGGRVKTDWTRAPFVASFRGISINACTVTANGRSSCSGSAAGSWWNQAFDIGKLQWVRDNFMTYDYCRDAGRFPQPPPEC